MVSRSNSQQTPFWLSCEWLWGLILILAVILVYSPVWWAGFIWDDDFDITANPVIIGPLGLKEIWTTSAAQHFPLVLTTFWVEHALWGLNPLPYHIVNVFLHGFCAVLLWRVLRSLQIPGAWLGAALWAVHPVQVESVAWIAETKNTQSCLFYLLSILFFVRWLRARDTNERPGGDWSYGLTMLFAALAIASKSSTVILPIVLCLCAWWVEGRWQWRNLARVGPIFLVSIAAGVVAIWTQGAQQTGIGEPLWVRTWPVRLMTAGDSVWFYLGKLIWPNPLIMIYPVWDLHAGHWLSYLPLLGVIIVLIILWLKRLSWSRPALFAWAYFLVALLPILGLVNNTYFSDGAIFASYCMVADHFQYLGSMGPLALAGAGFARLEDILRSEMRWPLSISRVGILLLLGVLSWEQAWTYESQETLWTDTLSQNPDCWIGHDNLGFALVKNGRMDEAMAHFQKAFEIKPNAAAPQVGLGIVLGQTGKLDEAILHYVKALQVDPGYFVALVNLGNALLQEKQPDKAIIQLHKALEINPYVAEAYFDLGNAYFQKGQAAEAETQYEKALKMDPNLEAAYNNLGNALLSMRRADEAIVQLQNALERSPNAIEAHYNLGLAFLQKGKTDEAIAEFQQVLQLNPGDSGAQAQLVKAKARSEQPPNSK